MGAEKLSEHKPQPVDETSCNVTELEKPELFLRALGEMQRKFRVQLKVLNVWVTCLYSNWEEGITST